MDIATLWVLRKSDTIPELLVAWDAYSLEVNYREWEEDCARATKALGDTEFETRFLNISVNDDELLKYFEQFQTINGKVTTELDDPSSI